jgi:uncharacterized protein YueI
MYLFHASHAQETLLHNTDHDFAGGFRRRALYSPSRAAVKYLETTLQVAHMTVRKPAKARHLQIKWDVMTYSSYLMKENRLI